MLIAGRRVSSPEKQIVLERAIEAQDRPRAPAALLGFLALSAAAHAALIIALPDFPLDRPPPAVTVLEVVLVQSEPEPPRPLPVAEARAEPARVVTPKAAKPRPVPKPVPASRPAEAALPVLTLPEPAPAPDLVAPAAAERPKETAPREISPPTRVAVAVPTPPSFSASYLQNPAPRYPLAARRAGEQGTVTLKVLVTSEGLPQRVEVERTSGSTRLDTAALEAVRRWRFLPARRGDSAIESWVLVPVVFRLEDPS